jgi:hypothetical protein
MEKLDAQKEKKKGGGDQTGLSHLKRSSQKFHPQFWRTGLPENSTSGFSFSNFMMWGSVGIIHKKNWSNLATG